MLECQVFYRTKARSHKSSLYQRRRGYAYSLSQDILLEVVEIYCDNCKASTEDNMILDDEGKVIDLTEQDIPDIGY